MKYLTAIAFVAVFCLAWPLRAQNIQQHKEMLYPTVLIDAASGTGSGTVIYSHKSEGAASTFILTNYHVIGGNITVEEVWDGQKKKEIKKERRIPVDVYSFEYNEYSRAVGKLGKSAAIVAYDKHNDLALLKLNDTERTMRYVAAVIPKDTPIYNFDTVWAVGAGKGKPPFPTEGVIANQDLKYEDRRFLLSTSPIIFGNSGGSLYRYSNKRNRYELIGVPSAVEAAQFGFSVQAVTHMAWCIPMETVRRFLNAAEYTWILD